MFNKWLFGYSGIMYDTKCLTPEELLDRGCVIGFENKSRLTSFYKFTMGPLTFTFHYSQTFFFVVENHYSRIFQKDTVSAHLQPAYSEEILEDQTSEILGKKSSVYSMLFSQCIPGNKLKGKVQPGSSKSISTLQISGFKFSFFES